MKFLPLRDFDVITSALNFTTAEGRVKGGCDLYTTKAAGSDKKLYKAIENSLEAQHAALMQFGASLSPPQRKEMAASLNLSRSSPFGRLSETSSRRTFAYLIATLNASHPDYDFSHLLRPTDFRREDSLRHVMANIDSVLHSVRPLSSSLFPPNAGSSVRSYSSSPGPNATGVGDVISSPAWGPEMWTKIDKEMTLTDCSIFSYQPADDPFDGDEAAIWQMHYFFFNKDKKRVAYLYVRGLPTMVTSPALAPHHRGSYGPLKRYAPPLPGSQTGNKRAKYWFGDQLADRIVDDDDDYDDYDDDDGIPYDPDDDIEIDPLNDPSTEEEDSDDYGDSESEESEIEESETEVEHVAHSIRGVSEDIAARMEI